MHNKYDTRAFVLKARPHKEDSVEVLLFTEELGKVRAVAQAAKQPGATFAAATEPGTFGYYTLLKGRYQWRVVGMNDLTQYSFTLQGEIKEAYLKMLGLFSRLLPEEESHIEVFNKLENFLEENPEDIVRVEAEVVFSLLSELGYVDRQADISNKTKLIQEVNKGILTADL